MKHDINGGKIVEICKSEIDNSVITKIDAFSDGTLSLEIPSSMVYSLVGLECEQDSSQILVIMDQEEIPLLDLFSTNSSNIFTLSFDKGIHIVEFIGTTIIPYPAPSQYCGIVEGYDKLYLAPLDQVDHGVEPEFVKCNEGLFLIQKNNGSPACVKQSTALKLIERGWVKTSTDGPSSRHCSLVPETGPCKAAFTRYYFDPETNICKSFTWGGCDGTVPFDTLELCQALCS